MSVLFCDACQGGEAYGKTALPLPCLFSNTFPGRLPSVSVGNLVSLYCSPQTRDRALRANGRGSRM
ncbi:hypothetical protein BZY71_21115 [Leclercia adecarboxylata]|nr:hypothetical protein BZY71_21115 [Leclercia adecarboxylata]